MSDSYLEFRLVNSKSPLARDLMTRILNGPSNRYQTAVVCRIQGSESAEKNKEYPVRVLSFTEQEINLFVENQKDPREMTRFENNLASKLGIPDGKLLAAPVSYFSRTNPYDIQIFTHDGQLRSLFNERDPHHKESMTRESRDIKVIRISTDQKYRNEVYAKGDVIQEATKEIIKGY